MESTQLFDFLEEKALFYEGKNFIAHDPISIPHRFSKLQDIEIAGFFAALFAWGQRKTILNKCTDLLERMDNAPYDFIKHHQTKELQRFLSFTHRTFLADDILFLIFFLQRTYAECNSLEEAFLVNRRFESVEQSLRNFHTNMFALPEAPLRTKKHISTPAKQSSCKRLCMFLRWMVRSSAKGVDFGIWKKIPTHSLICPLDIHVSRVSVQLGLLDNPKSNWQNAVSLTKTLSLFDPHDPVKYDFALFNLGVAEGWK